MPTVRGSGLFAALDRLSRADSLLRADRVCLASAQGRLPDLRGRNGFIVHWMGSSLPWFLRPLAIIVAAGRCVVELTQASSVESFARAADGCFTVTFCSFSRSLLPSVLSQLRSEGWDEASGVANRDPTYAELEFNCDHDGDDRFLVLTRFNRECPPDLSKSLMEIDDLDDNESLEKE